MKIIGTDLMMIFIRVLTPQILDKSLVELRTFFRKTEIGWKKLGDVKMYFSGTSHNFMTIKKVFFNFPQILQIIFKNYVNVQQLAIEWLLLILSRNIINVIIFHLFSSFPSNFFWNHLQIFSHICKLVWLSCLEKLLL